MLAFLIVLTILGIVNASYLVFSSYRKKPLICLINHQCNEVVKSKWSKIFHVPNDLLGLLFYIFLLSGIFITIITQKYIEIISLVILIATSLALLFSIYLTVIQLFFLRKRCFYCFISALINLFIFLIIVLNY